jgi:hypothetical protein
VRDSGRRRASVRDDLPAVLSQADILAEGDRDLCGPEWSGGGCDSGRITSERFDRLLPE